jgi:hypothetical protein
MGVKNLRSSYLDGDQPSDWHPKLKPNGLREIARATKEHATAAMESPAASASRIATRQMKSEPLVDQPPPQRSEQLCFDE